MSDDWPHEYLPGADTAPVLLALHGTGGTERDGIYLAQQLDPRATVIAPRGRVTEQGMTRWFRRLEEGVFDVDDVERRSDDLAEWTTDLITQQALAGRPLVAVGFSNGANMALATALRHPTLVSRVIAFSGMYPFGDRPAQASLSGVKLLLLNGHDDPMAPRASVERLQAVATELGADSTRVERPGGHGVSADELEEARRWLAEMR